MKIIETKSILSKSKDPKQWFGINYNMNLYRGCPHGCIYCDSRSNCYHIDDFDQVRIKKDALFILDKELKSKRHRGIVGIGSMSDTYNPFEKELKITRQALELLEKYQFGVSIDTKSDLILRDIDILLKIKKNKPVIVKVTITTMDDNLSKKIEPYVAYSSKRWETIRILSNAGIFTGILLTPVLPYLTDSVDNIKKIVKTAHQVGAKFIFTYMSMTLRENQRDYYYEQLEKLFPGLQKKYEENYHYQYVCPPKNAKKLYEIFCKECKKHGILYNMNDIINAYQKGYESYEQIQLF